MISRYSLNDDIAAEFEAVEAAPQTESDRARAWLASLDLDGMQKDDTQRAEFFKYELAAFRGERVYYLSSRSPQQKQHKWSHTTLARGDKEYLTEGMERFIREMERKQERVNERKEAKKQARVAFVNPYKVGQFLHSHWGYEQTNVEMYQILEVREFALKIRRVAQDRQDTHHDQGTCTPIKDKFIEPAKWVTIQVGTHGHHSVPSPIHGNLYEYDGKPVSWSSYY